MCQLRALPEQHVSNVIARWTLQPMPTNRYRGPPMTLANMRANGVRSLWVVCDICHHEAVMNIDRFGDCPQSIPAGPTSRPVPALLRASYDRPIPLGGRLRRSHSKGRAAKRSAGASAHQVRNGAQPQDREGTRHRGAHLDHAARRRGDWKRRLSRTPRSPLRAPLRSRLAMTTTRRYRIRA